MFGEVYYDTFRDTIKPLVKNMSFVHESLTTSGNEEACFYDFCWSLEEIFLFVTES